MTLHLYEFPSNPHGQLVVLSYANGFMPETYTMALSPLFEQYRVVAIHHRPLWQPAPPPETLVSWHVFGDDLLTSLSELTEQPVIGIGHSVGAVTTLYAAIDQPQRFSGVILIDPTMLPPTALRTIQLMRALGRETRIPLVRGALKRGRHWKNAETAYHYFRGKERFDAWSDEQVRIYSDSVTLSDGQGGRVLRFAPEWEAQIYRKLPVDVWGELPKFAKTGIPTLVLRAGKSNVFFPQSAKLFKKTHPSAAWVEFPTAGHLVPQEQPEVVGDAIRAWVTSTVPVP
jgi:pimeloyl-ACP methyl ester carboxylesterase